MPSELAITRLFKSDAVIFRPSGRGAAKLMARVKIDEWAHMDADLDHDDRRHGMSVVVEYAAWKGKAQWVDPKPFHGFMALFKYA